MRASLVAEVAPVLAPGVYDTRKHTRSKHACATANYAVQLSPVFGMSSILLAAQGGLDLNPRFYLPWLARPSQVIQKNHCSLEIRMGLMRLQ